MLTYTSACNLNKLVHTD